LNLRQMVPSDLGFAARCANDVGWASTTEEQFAASLAYDPEGCFVAAEKGARIGMCIATKYGESGFVGNLIVAEEMRGRGVGRQLLDRAIDYLHGCGTRNILLDSVPAAVSLYERAGFSHVCPSLRFSGPVRGQVTPQVRQIQVTDLEAVRELDREAFGADRWFFLEDSWSLNPRLGKVLEQQGQIVGFILGRAGHGVVGVGPWIARPGTESAGLLLESLAAAAAGLPLSLGVLETSVAAVRFIRSLGMSEKQVPSYRMVLGPSAYVGSSPQCWAVGSPAKG
jgi:predicted N-acetyltransferase YhbS